jgi:hypothetical protein
MGTSSARRPPGTRLWRLSRGAATRYLAPAAPAPALAGEVVARYLAALGEGSGEEAGALASFRHTRKVAQELGALAALAQSRGWPAALQPRGLEDLTPQPREVLAQSLAAALCCPGPHLEAAAVRVALTSILMEETAAPDPARWVGRFLAAALHARLALDLGESLEAAAPGCSPLRQALQRLKDLIESRTASATPVPPPAPEHWQGLAGWLWITSCLEGLLRQLGDLRR